MLLHNLATVGQSFAIVHWLMGNIDPVPAPTLAGLALIVLPVSLLACATARHWNLMAVGEDWAAARGPRRSGCCSAAIWRPACWRPRSPP